MSRPSWVGDRSTLNGHKSEFRENDEKLEWLTKLCHQQSIKPIRQRPGQLKTFKNTS